MDDFVFGQISGWQSGGGVVFDELLQQRRHRGRSRRWHDRWGQGRRFGGTLALSIFGFVQRIEPAQDGAGLGIGEINAAQIPGGHPESHPLEVTVAAGQLKTDAFQTERAVGTALAAHHLDTEGVGQGRRGRAVTSHIGAGQMARVDSSRIAVWKAGEAGLDLAGSVVVSEALFPFADGLIAAADAGATAAIQPGGSVRDEEVIKAADERGMAMVFTGLRHFRH